MNKNMLALALIAVGATAPAISMAAQPGDGAFVSVQAGQSRLQGMSASNDTDTGYGMDVGYRWAVSPMAQVGFEVGYLNQGTFADNYLGSRVTAKVSGAKAGVNAKFNFTPNWFLMVQGGYFNAHNKVGVQSGGLSYSDSKTKGTWYSGVGFGYDFANNTSLSLNYNYMDDKYNDQGTHLDLSSNQVAVRFEARF
jgi:opacity protein-like surface antigen